MTRLLRLQQEVTEAVPSIQGSTRLGDTPTVGVIHRPLRQLGSAADLHAALDVRKP
jgi:hypothetical protein